MATCNASSLLTANPFTQLDPGLQDAVKLQLLCDISSGGTGIGGSGTAGRLAKFTAGTTLGDSLLSESGQDVTINTGRLVINRGTITALSPALDVATTWDNAAVTFTGVRYDVTDTASASGSLLMDLRVGGASRSGCRKDGSGWFSAALSVGGAGFGVGTGVLIEQTKVRAYNNGVIWLGSASGTANDNISQIYMRPTATVDWGGDTILARDAADTLAQRRTTNAQTFNIYNTYTSSTSYERGFLSWVSNEFRIGTEKGSGGGSARALAFQTDGNTRLTITTGGSLLIAATTAPLGWTSSTLITPIDGNGTLRLSNNAASDFNRLQFGGTTSSFPALKRSAATLECRLADDSGFAMFASEFLSITDGISAPGAVAGRARIYVDTADGDLKVVFGDGTVKTIVTDT